MRSSPKRTNVQVVEKLLTHAVRCIECALSLLLLFRSAKFVELSLPSLSIDIIDQCDALIIGDKFGFLSLRGARKAIVRWIAEDNDNLGGALYLLRSVVFITHLGKIKLHVTRVVPARKCVGTLRVVHLFWVLLRGTRAGDKAVTARWRMAP